jgi:hypothetical protein
MVEAGIQETSQTPKQKKTKILIAVHGIGDQLQCSTIQQVANQLCRFYGDPADIPLGQLHAKIISPHMPVPGPLDRISLSAEIKPGMTLGAIPVTPVGQRDPFVPVYAVGGKKHFPQADFEFGLAEIYWADIARAFAKDGYSLEDTKAWGRTIVARTRARSEFLRDNGLAEEVVPQIVEGIHVMENVFFLSEKAFGIKFDLARVLRDYVGDVQQVAEFENIRVQILKAFQNSLTAIASKNPDAEIYFFAHSEGTVVTFLALLSALADIQSTEGDKQDGAAWVKNVRGMMTIGSPIDKHLHLWPELFTQFENQNSLTNVLTTKIKWQNYYDYGDPVGFDLDDARVWLKTHKWDQYFAFDSKDDFGFARYLFPGKAHLDYFDDDRLFDHFFHNTVGLQPPHTDSKTTRPPKSRNLWGFAPVSLMATLIPYLLTFCIFTLGIYLFYRGASAYAPIQEAAWDTARNVAGLAMLVWCLTFAASVVRVTNVATPKTQGWQLTAYLVALAGIAIAYQLLTEAALLRGVIVVPDSLRQQLGVKGIYLLAVVSLLATIPLAVTTLQVRPQWRRWLCVFGVLGAMIFLFYIRVGDDSAYGSFVNHRGADPTAKSDLRLLKEIAGNLKFPGRILPAATTIESLAETENESTDVQPELKATSEVSRDSPPPEVWPLILGGAMLFYLWWLTIILLDLTIVWHMYIRLHTRKD